MHSMPPNFKKRKNIKTERNAKMSTHAAETRRHAKRVNMRKSFAMAQRARPTFKHWHDQTKEIEIHCAIIKQNACAHFAVLLPAPSACDSETEAAAAAAAAAAHVWLRMPSAAAASASAAASAAVASAFAAESEIGRAARAHAAAAATRSARTRTRRSESCT